MPDPLPGPQHSPQSLAAAHQIAALFVQSLLAFAARHANELGEPVVTAGDVEAVVEDAAETLHLTTKVFGAVEKNWEKIQAIFAKGS